MNFRATFKARLLEARKRKGLSQRALSDISGVSAGCISQLETGKYLPILKTFVQLAVSLEVPTDYLLGLDSGREILGCYEVARWS